MKARVEAKEFSAALDRVSKILKKTAIPVLSEVKVQFEKGMCTLTATDLNTWVVMRVPAEGEDFSFVFSRTKEVAKACRMFDGALEVELHEEGQRDKRRLNVLLNCMQRGAEFEAIPPEDYPEMYTMKQGDLFTCSASWLLERISRVGYAAMKPSVKEAAARYSIQFSGTHVFAVDGRRLACDTDVDFLFPRAFMAPLEPLMLLKLFEGRNVAVMVDEKFGCISDGMALVLFRNGGKNVFDVDAAFPRDRKEVFRVSPREMLQELKYLKEFANHVSDPYVRFRGGEMVMPAAAGKCRTSVPIQGHNEIMFVFDLRLMMDAMRQFQSEKVVKIAVSSAVAPLVVSADGREDRALVCPARLSDRLLAA